MPGRELIAEPRGLRRESPGSGSVGGRASRRIRDDGTNHAQGRFRGRGDGEERTEEPRGRNGRSLPAPWSADPHDST